MDINIRQSNLAKSSGPSEMPRRGGSVGQAAMTTDQAGVSGSSGLLSLAMQLAEPAVSPRVEELRSAIQSGNYAINYQAVSRSMVDSALQFE